METVETGLSKLQHVKVFEYSQKNIKISVLYVLCFTARHSLSTVLCSNLSNPANGEVNVPSRTVSSVATYTCNEGFELNGVATCEGIVQSGECSHSFVFNVCCV